MIPQLQELNQHFEVPPKPKQTLFELGAIAQSLEAQIDTALIASEGEVTLEIEQMMDEFLRDVDLRIEEKLDAIGFILRKLNARIAYRKGEAKRYSDMAAVDQNNAERLKARTLVYMEFVNKTKQETNNFKFSIAANGGVLPMEINAGADPANVPVQFQKPEFDKAAIREVLESGVRLGFAKLGERGRSLRIK